MKKTLAVLIGATALTAVLGLPAWSALGGGGAAAPRPATLQAPDMKDLLRLVDDDEGEDDDMPKAQRSERDDDGAGEEDDDDDDEDGGSAGTGNPAPAGSAPPPSNGLFGNGTAPKAQVN